MGIRGDSPLGVQQKKRNSTQAAGKLLTSMKEKGPLGKKSPFTRKEEKGPFFREKALRIHPKCEVRKVVPLSKNPHRCPQPDAYWGPLRSCRT